MTRAFILVLTLFSSAACGQSALSDYDFTEQQAIAVRTLLDEGVGRRLVITADNWSSMLEDQRQEQPDYEPYFATGDFDGDGVEDFVVATQEGNSYDVYLIRGATDGYHPASWFAGMEWLHEAGMFVKEDFRRASDMIGIGSFFSDDGIWFGWDEETGQLEALPSDMDE